MPLYRFHCEDCHVEEVKKATIGNKDLPLRCSSCKGSLKRYVAVPSAPSIMEVGSKFHGWKQRKGMGSVLKKRARQDMLDNIGELVEKHGYDIMKRTRLMNNGKKRTTWDEK